MQLKNEHIIEKMKKERGFQHPLYGNVKSCNLGCEQVLFMNIPDVLDVMIRHDNAWYGSEHSDISRVTYAVLYHI